MFDCTVIILGSTGDLAKRKLLPALYTLLQQKNFSKLLLVGAAREQIDITTLLHRVKASVDQPDETVFKELENSTLYFSLDFTKEEDFFRLHDFITDQESRRGMSGNRLVYVAAHPNFFCPITEYVGMSKLLRRSSAKTQWNRIVYEKPFGFDKASAHAINTCITAWFNEDQVYRIDHYLTKELVGNIAVVRFTNIVLEPLWNHTYIDHVEITLTEEIGIEGRAQYYDAYGAVRDVVQNHMLQLLALTAMEGPHELQGAYIQDEKTKVLKKTRVVDGILGQYKGYKQEVANPSSMTPTFALFRVFVDTPRWKGIPFFLKTGKKLAHKDISIVIKFKDVICPLEEYKTCYSNYLHITVAPDSGFSLELNAKKPGYTDDVTPIQMHFCHSCIFGHAEAEAYEVLFKQILIGEQSVSVRFDEIEYAWDVIDNAHAIAMPLYEYQPGTDGPAEASAYLQKHNVEWKS
jgi:glucose-6-phosphate 1-dehydrogenase